MITQTETAAAERFMVVEVGGQGDRQRIVCVRGALTTCWCMGLLTSILQGATRIHDPPLPRFPPYLHAGQVHSRRPLSNPTPARGANTRMACPEQTAASWFDASWAASNGPPVSRRGTSSTMESVQLSTPIHIPPDPRLGASACQPHRGVFMGRCIGYKTERR